MAAWMMRRQAAFTPKMPWNANALRQFTA